MECENYLENVQRERIRDEHPTYMKIYILPVFFGGKTAFYNPVIILDNYFVLL